MNERGLIARAYQVRGTRDTLQEILARGTSCQQGGFNHRRQLNPSRTAPAVLCSSLGDNHCSSVCSVVGQIEAGLPPIRRAQAGGVGVVSNL